jgi:hypothetical protein
MIVHRKTLDNKYLKTFGENTIIDPSKSLMEISKTFEVKLILLNDDFSPSTNYENNEYFVLTDEKILEVGDILQSEEFGMKRSFIVEYPIESYYGVAYKYKLRSTGNQQW